MRNYTLITGATGLLGAYILRDLLSQGISCAVLVRPSRIESATQRIESILAFMERNLGTTLPRPVVLEGTLSENFGLGTEEIHWVQQHCGRLLHNAASLIFERDPKTNEPYRSNVEGTKFAIDFAIQYGIPQFHHVSTAYVCGLRHEVCREDELDVGQEWGNDYEKAKVIAEKMVRNASFAEPPTFYRPAIITGDSVTGYTSTYHGFYTPLKVAASLVADQAFHGSVEDILHFLGMAGGEHKNFVPVEWISQAIVSLLSQKGKGNIGKTFHLTPQNRVTVSEMYDVFTKAIQLYGERHSEKLLKKEKTGSISLSPEKLLQLMESFRDQMKVYRSYWRDDPIFDASNTKATLPDLPCPEMTPDVLLRLSMFALESNFGWPKASPLVPPYFVRDFLPVQASWADSNFKQELNSGLINKTNSVSNLNEHRSEMNRSKENVVAVSVLGPGGGDWTFRLNGEKLSVQNGFSSDAPNQIKLGIKLFDAIRRGMISPQEALQSGAVFFRSLNSQPLKMSDAIRFLTAVIPNK